MNLCVKDKNVAQLINHAASLFSCFFQVVLLYANFSFAFFGRVEISDCQAQILFQALGANFLVLLTHRILYTHTHIYEYK